MYEKVKKITIWIPVLGVVLMSLFEKDQQKPIYDSYFDWGSPLLVPISLIWQIMWIGYIVINIIGQYLPV